MNPAFPISSRRVAGRCGWRTTYHDHQPAGGKYKVPDLPGIGQALNDDVVKQYHAYTVTA